MFEKNFQNFFFQLFYDFFQLEHLWESKIDYSIQSGFEGIQMYTNISYATTTILSSKIIFRFVSFFLYYWTYVHQTTHTD